MPDKSDDFLLQIYLDEVKCNDPEDYYNLIADGDEFVIAGVSQSGTTLDEYDKANREIRTKIFQATPGKTHPFSQTEATLFAKRVKPEEYVLVSFCAFDLDFGDAEWNKGARELAEALVDAAKRGADEAVRKYGGNGGGKGVKAGDVVIEGRIVAETAKIVLDLIPKALDALFGMDKQDDLGSWAPPRLKAKDWREKEGKIHIPLKSDNYRGKGNKASRTWDYDVTVGIKVDD